MGGSQEDAQGWSLRGPPGWRFFVWRSAMESDLVQKRVFALRQVRLSLGLSADEVSRRAGVERSTLSTYEIGKSLPPENVLARWEASLIALAKLRSADAQAVLRELEGV